MRTVCYLFGPIAAVGLLLTFVEHIAALFDRAGPLGDREPLLMGGVFVVLVPAALVAGQLVREARTRDVWKPVMEVLAPWMKVALVAICVYGLLNFVVFGLFKQPTGQETRPAAVRRGSGHLLIFYASALTILYSGSRRR